MGCRLNTAWQLGQQEGEQGEEQHMAHRPPWHADFNSSFAWQADSSHILPLHARLSCSRQLAGPPHLDQLKVRRFARYHYLLRITQQLTLQRSHLESNVQQALKSPPGKHNIARCCPTAVALLLLLLLRLLLLLSRLLLWLRRQGVRLLRGRLLPACGCGAACLVAGPHACVSCIISHCWPQRLACQLRELLDFSCRLRQWTLNYCLCIDHCKLRRRSGCHCRSLWQAGPLPCWLP